MSANIIFLKRPIARVKGCMTEDGIKEAITAQYMNDRSRGLSHEEAGPLGNGPSDSKVEEFWRSLKNLGDQFYNQGPGS
jgi:hypothetical protein